tara:strand:+ start:212 stop:505 length:294 start_codon:yes stop_codon:yes gene_type:complete
MKGLVLRQLGVTFVVLMLFLYTTAISVFAGQSIQDHTTTSSSNPEANLPYLFAVYTITWVAFFAYLYYISQRQQNLKRQIEDLKQALSEKNSESDLS